MNLNKEININKKFIVLFLLVNIVALCFYYSYALFQVNVIKNNAIVINTSSSLPSITTTIDDTSLNTFTLSANSSKTVSVKITASTTSAMAYKMYYDVEGYGTFRVTSTESFPNNLVEGTFTNMKTISLTFTNSSSSDLTIILGTVGGFESTGATLNGQTELILNQDITIKEPPIRIKSNNTSSTCQNVTYKEDGIIYLSGSSDCIDFNYLWYSGKMWRITAIYPDGAMKMVTDNNITSIAFNESSVNFYTNENTTSYMYQWLNEDFYDTLYNASNIIDTTKSWNATMVDGRTIKPGTSNLVTANVGLLNSYEYYNSFRNLGSCGSGYLNIGYYWWLLNPYSESVVWRVSNYCGTANDGDSYKGYGVRPSVYLKSGVSLTGTGSKTAPYKIVGDIVSGTENQTINTRISGEYVKLSNNGTEQLFRIVEIVDNKTKIVAMNYAGNKAKKNNDLWGSDATTGAGTWYTYLNSTYYPNLVSTYGELFDSGFYYLGTSGNNYKLSVCANTTSGNTKVCDKTSDSGTFNIGLLRYGEMFATQQGSGYSSSINMWLINRYSSSDVWFVNYYGQNAASSTSYAHGARPTVHLKSTVKILSGSGTELDPYVVGL